MASSHSRASSSDTTTSSGTSYPLILEHILGYPGTYQMPLKTMYTLNCAPRAQPYPHPLYRNASPTSTASNSPTEAHFGWQDDHVTQQFTSSLMAQMAQLPHRPRSLPPSFVTSFVCRCFPADLIMVDFPQALTGLDYLKDLETRRRREVAAALNRLGIERDTFGSDTEDIAQRFPGVAAWVRSLEEKERKVETLYTQLYIGLRRWVLINEMSLQPFNKHNCAAMLNTLYPPVVTSQPTTKLTSTILKQQRDGFFKYIQSVERNGPHVLRNLMQQGKKPGDGSGWTAVHNVLDMYLQVANSMISECQVISNIEDLSPQLKRKGGKADSGISLPSSRRTSSTESGTTKSRAQSPSDAWLKTTTSSSSLSIPTKPSSTLEKIARELKKIGRPKLEAEEMIMQQNGGTIKSKTLRKMRSLGALGDLRAANLSSLSVSQQHSRDVPAFDADEMRRHRQTYEATVQRVRAPRSHEV
ncbi:hypothetical protein LTR66_001798 [Elasticomyces elasticus]|nr:hypothetical protein LTR50_001856 [Elasticomyces elasticus]KAK4999122.1 hypothetical protein LTR66_001798 [Elasticomyces elasticus]